MLKCMCGKKKLINYVFIEIQQDEDYNKKDWKFCEDCGLDILLAIQDIAVRNTEHKRNKPYFLGLPRWYVKWYIRHFNWKWDKEANDEV